ncbi:DUF87 domain-containing protein [Streptomyces sp. A1499]|uniref:ATP-binding protein n=1 Tax=Streptomyces sp. A1499 TaxID=2563104 RepID=UPI00109E454E|nr:DUF87 domain-containing protein [Streptomyces sp. A1499]THC49316.1 ATP-binding protein [Streptomyces sp. A1499]
MVTDPITTATVDYFQRAWLVPELPGETATAGPPHCRRVVRIAGVGRPTRPAPPRVDGTPVEPHTLPLLVGLAGAGVPIAFLLEGHGEGVGVRLGTWSQDGVSDAALDARQAMLLAVFDASYPAVDTAAAAAETPALGYGAVGLGVPAPPVADPRDGALPVDRLVRSMTGRRWAALVLAAPAGADELGADRNRVLNEIRAVAAAVQAADRRSPLAEHYQTLLESRLDALADAQRRGGWRTAVYLLGEHPRDLAALTSAWRAVFSGGPLVPEAVRTVTHPTVAELATGWALPDGPERPGPSGYQHPYNAQTLLSSAQLASYVCLPALETAGFSVRVVPRFDVVSPPFTGPGVDIGSVVERDRPSGTGFAVPLDSLARHVFVAGVTGSGKSNSVLHLIRQVAAAGAPFLVIEPAKAEYRALLRDPAVGPSLRVFTLGRETVSPLRLNPFEVPEGVSVAAHIDLLRAAFEGAFGMWVPLPQVLERCLHEVYEDRGWDLRTDSNHRLDPDAAAWSACPTLSDLVTKIPTVSRSLGYDADVTANVEAALSTRVNSLRVGGKGALLDVPRSFPTAELLAAPTVVELEAMGSDDDKAFVMGLLLIRLAEHRRAQGQRSALTHLFVVEEAHRLLGAVRPARGENVADPRAGAVETFSNLLSEIRAYGQGVVIADQVPTRLDPSVLKNTLLKLAHRTVAADDRFALATTMGMDQKQSEALVPLDVGRAAVFGHGADAPVLVQVPPAKDDRLIRETDDGAVRDTMARWRRAAGWDAYWLARPSCAAVCVGHSRECEAARALLDDSGVRRTFTRIALSLLADAGSLERTWPDLVQTVRPRRPPRLDETALLRCLASHAPDWYAERQGARAGWTYSATLEYAELLRLALLAPAGSRAAAVETFRAFATARHACDIAPYPGCDAVCPDHTCLYRGAAADVVATGRYDASWAEADAADRGEGDREATWGVCDAVAYELMEYPPDDASPEQRARISESRRRVGLCFAQQMIAADPTELPRSARRIIDTLLARPADGSE